MAGRLLFILNFHEIDDLQLFEKFVETFRMIFVSRMESNIPRNLPELQKTMSSQ